MKKILLIIISFFIGMQVVSASTKTYTRTESDYRVPSNITVSSSNKSVILKTPSVDASEKIYDFADLFTNLEEEELYKKATNFISSTNYDLAIVTISENNKTNAMHYADDFYDYNDFGKNSSRDGLLILIDMDTREIYISTTGLAIKMYNDNRIDKIIDAGYNQLKNKRYSECISNMISQSLSFYKNGYPSGNKNLEIDKDGHVTIVKRVTYGIIIFIPIVASVVVGLILYFKSRSVIKVQNTVSYLDPANSDVNQNATFSHTHTSRIPRSSGSSSSRGRSSFHSGSSGMSHGGGGRHF